MVEGSAASARGRKRPGRAVQKGNGNFDPEQESARVLVQLSRGQENSGGEDEANATSKSKKRRRIEMSEDANDDGEGGSRSARASPNKKRKNALQKLNDALASHDGQSLEARESEVAEPAEEDTMGLPMYSASQRSQARSNLANKPGSKAARGKRAGRDAPQAQGAASRKAADKSNDGEGLIDPELRSKTQPAAKRKKQKSASRAGQGREAEGDANQDVLDETLPYYSPYAAAANGQAAAADDSALDDRDEDADHTQLLAHLNSAIHGEDGSRGPPPKSKKKRGAKGQPKADQPSANGTAKERFSPEDIQKAEAFRDKWCEERGKTHADFNGLIQDNMRHNKFTQMIYEELQEMFPGHRHAYIQRFCRRKFHNFAARGVWSAADDELLRQAVSTHGTSWKKVGEEIGRFHEDCRDRWRNYLVHGDNRVREQWTEAEVLNLATAILDCTSTMREEKLKKLFEKKGWSLPPDNEEAEAAVAATVAAGTDSIDPSLINWQLVSERMGTHGGSRSRLQCSFKWNRMKEDMQQHYLGLARHQRENGGSCTDILQSHPSQTATRTSEWRARIANRKVKHMLAGDRYDLLQAILQSGAPSEGNIPWKAIGEQPHLGHWSTTERKAAWLMLKQEVPQHELLDYRDVIHQLMPVLHTQDISAHWDPAEYENARGLEKEAAKAEKKQKQQEDQKEQKQGKSNWIGLDPAMMNNIIGFGRAPVASMQEPSSTGENDK